MNAIPQYQLNPATGRGFTSFDDRSVLFGPYEAAQSIADYDRTLASWLSNGRRLPSDGPPTIIAPSPSGFGAPKPWPEFTAELLSLYHISMRARATKQAMQETMHSLAALGVENVGDITTGLIAKWVATQRPTLSPNTIKGRLRYILRVCNYAYTQRYLEVNPFVVAPLRTWVRSAPPKLKKCHTVEEISRVIAEMRRQVDTSDGWTQWRARRLYALTAALACMGLRANEAYHLHTVDVDLSKRVLHVVARERLKTFGSAGILPLPPWLVPVLQEWSEHRMDCPIGFVHDADCRWLFPATRKKAPWTSGSPGCRPRDRMVEVAMSVGVSGFTPLSLRHSAATNLTALGAGPNLVRLFLRHTNNSTQQWYVHPSLDILREGVERIAF